MHLTLDEVRRLTGPNLLWDKPGAIADVFFTGVEPVSVVTCWAQWVETIQSHVDWQEQTTYRLFDGGASLALSAPMDALYSACEIVELAWHCAAAELQKGALPNWQSTITEIAQELNAERNPQLLAMMQAAIAHNVTCISDDDDVSLGMGHSVDVWPVRDLPALEQINWSKYSDVPRAFITGTNGKSTSVRLAAQIAKAAGINAGVTSTDFIKVGDEIIDEGDYSGPGGARMLLRDKRTEMAFLEVARGGILRRGIPVDSVQAALITNVASDHLGQYGINTVQELAKTKFVVAKGLGTIGTLVANADNALVVAQAKQLNVPLCWYSTDENNPLIQANLKTGEAAVFIRDGHLIYQKQGITTPFLALTDIPMTMQGKAQHNVQNALGVVGLCMALELPISAIQKGLRDFGSSAQDNPGRGNIYQVQGATVIVDFAHNEHSMRAIVNTANQLPANNKIAMFSHAGDRSDQEITDLTHAVARFNADEYIVAELEVYLRGRHLGEIPSLAKQVLTNANVPSNHISVASNPLEGVKLALRGVKNGDLILLFVLSDREKVHNYLTNL